MTLKRAHDERTTDRDTCGMHTIKGKRASRRFIKNTRTCRSENRDIQIAAVVHGTPDDDQSFCDGSERESLAVQLAISRADGGSARRALARRRTVGERGELVFPADQFAQPISDKIANKRSGSVDSLPSAPFFSVLREPDVDANVGGLRNSALCTASVVLEEGFRGQAKQMSEDYEIIQIPRRRPQNI